jgi:ribonuclease P protein component
MVSGGGCAPGTERRFWLGVGPRDVTASVCDTARPGRSEGHQVGQRYPHRARLRRRSEIRAVFDRGLRIPGRLLALWTLRGTQETRAVIVAGRRVGGAAARNRAKRLLREAYRLNRGRIHVPSHLALVAQRDCVGASRLEVEAELLSLLESSGCLRPAGGQRCPGH